MAHRDSHPFDDGSLWLTDGGVETVLIHHHGVALPGFATFPLLEQRKGRTALRTYIEPFLELARERIPASCWGRPPGVPTPTGAPSSATTRQR